MVPQMKQHLQKFSFMEFHIYMFTIHSRNGIGMCSIFILICKSLKKFIWKQLQKYSHQNLLRYVCYIVGILKVLYLLYFIDYIDSYFKNKVFGQSTFCIERYAVKVCERRNWQKSMCLFQCSLQFSYSLTILTCFDSLNSL
jgi:hypothetical protein